MTFSSGSVFLANLCNLGRALRTLRFRDQNLRFKDFREPLDPKPSTLNPK